MDSYEGNISIGDLKRQAKEKLHGNFGKAALAQFIFYIVVSCSSSVISVILVIPFGSSLFSNLKNYNSDNLTSYQTVHSAISFIIFTFVIMLVVMFVRYILEYGMNGFCFKLSRDEPADIENIFDGFKRIPTVLGMQFMKGLFIFLWRLLFFIPGIIAFYRYKISLFILADNPEMKAMDAISLSKKMMKGNKGKLFLMHLSFIGWFLLMPFTICIGFFWLIPYITTSEACFYNNVKANYMRANGLLDDNQNNSSNISSYGSLNTLENTDNQPVNDYHTAE